MKGSYDPEETVRREARRALEALGRTPKAVAASLREGKFVGDPRSEADNPVALYLAREYPEYMVKVRIPGREYDTDARAILTCHGRGSTTYISVYVPFEVVNFMHWLVLGEWEELVRR